MLDLARLLFSRRLEQLQASGDEHDAPTVRHVRERLADTHDLLSEISLENERYLPIPSLSLPLSPPFPLPLPIYTCKRKATLKEKH